MRSTASKIRSSYYHYKLHAIRIVSFTALASDASAPAAGNSGTIAYKDNGETGANCINSYLIYLLLLLYYKNTRKYENYASAREEAILNVLRKRFVDAALFDN